MVIRKLSATKAEIKFYGDIGTWFTDAEMFSGILDSLEQDGYKEVVIRLHCYGGSVFEGNVIGNNLAKSKLNISIVIEGIAASMGCMILHYLPAEKISIADNGLGMIHRPVVSTRGDQGDLLAAAKLLGDLEANFVDVISKRTKKTKEEIKALFFDGKDHWLSADEMVSYGIAGKKVTAIADLPILDKQILGQAKLSDVYNRFINKLNYQIHNSMNKELIITAFALTGVTADSSDADILKALQAKFKANEDRITALETEAKAKVVAATKKMLDDAQAAGKFKPEARATFEAIAQTSGIEALEVVLGMPAAASGTERRPAVAEMIQTGTPGAQAAVGDKNWDWYQKNAVASLEKMQTTDPENFKKLYAGKYGVSPE